jgi:hypothetical protein
LRGVGRRRPLIERRSAKNTTITAMIKARIAIQVLGEEAVVSPAPAVLLGAALDSVAPLLADEALDALLDEPALDVAAGLAGAAGFDGAVAAPDLCAGAPPFAAPAAWWW